MAGWIDQIAKAQKTRRGTFLTDGRYRLALVNLIKKEGFKGLCVIAEVVVRESAVNREGIVPLAVGTRGSLVFNFATSKGAAGNTQELVEALLDEKLPTDEGSLEPIMVELVSAGQPMRGREFFANSFFIEKTQKGHPYTGFNFSPTTQTDEEQAASRAKIEAEGV